MSDFELLQYLQEELVRTLKERKKATRWIPRPCCKAKIHRLRIEIAEVMLRIENGCTYYKSEGKKEEWEEKRK